MSQPQQVLNLTFIGGGKIALAIMQGIVAKTSKPTLAAATQATGIATGGEMASSKMNIKFVIRAIDPNVKRVEELRAKGFTAEPSLSKQVADETDVMVIAVKPQHTSDALKAIAKNPLRETSLVLSVVAGLPLKTIADAAPGTSALIRAMPNTPSTIGRGVCVWAHSPETTQKQIETTRMILQAVGTEEHVADEDEVDTATAVSGSGPAYVLLLMEAMIDSACHMGMQRELARKLVEETFIGTAEYAKLTGKHPAVLRDEITSRGGTTAAALFTAEKGRFRAVVSEMMWAAYLRARQLGGKPPPQ
jgi:pyrroline-5-carboxylate reductase